MIETINPTTGEPISRYELHGDDEIAKRLAGAWSRFEVFRTVPVGDRATLLPGLAELLDARSEDLARLATEEMGKPLTQSRAEVDKSAWLARHYAEHGPGYLAPVDVETEARHSYVRFDPLGPIFAVMPWNFPYWQVFRHAIPAAVAGNTILLKHSANVLGVAHAIEELFAAAGFPPDFLQLLVVSHDTAAEVVADDRVRGVTLTGSVGAGAAIGALAGRHIKKSVLELGGSDAYLILDDADVARAARIGAKARMQNNGQSCIAAKRFIADASVYDDFVDALRAEMDAMTIGDPMEEETEVGPLAREDLRDDLHDQVRRAVKDGATIVCGGEPLDRPGFFYAATIVADITSANPVGHEETFGPVASVFRVESDEEALAVANATPFGLGASVWTADLERGERLAGLLDAGIVAVNEMVKSDPRLPFGGVKDSGYGRELGEAGAREFTNQRAVWVEDSGHNSDGTAVE